MGRMSFRTAARVGTGVMATILLTLVALDVGTLVWSRAEIADLESAIKVSDAYDQTAMNASLSSIFSTRYRNNRAPEDLESFQRALLDTLQFEARIKQLGSDEDRAYLASLEAQYAADLASAFQSIQAINEGTFDPDAFADSGALTEVTEALTDRAADQRDMALSDLASVHNTVETLSVAAVVLLSLGIPIVVGSYVLTRQYEHKETVRELELERLKQAALTDGLTGLANHRAFQEDLRREVARAARHERPITIAMMDVDDFKEINDTQGHARGDFALAELAGLMSYMRGQDRAYRVGGDEFALIMPETAPEDAGPALDRLRRTIETGVTPMSISIGYASTNDAYSPELLRDHADKALYEAKHKGKNQVAMFSLDLSSGTELTTAKTQALRRVLDTGNLEMWYQPIYHYGGEALLAFEALLRMPAEPEIEGPEEAFKIAESLGKARELDLLCVAGALNSAYNLPTDVKLFINLDPATLTNSRFSVRELTQLVDASPFERARIVFEVTEHSIVPVLTLRDQVEEIRAQGFGVALDDVGTGNSGLELMRLIKFDYVKIDRSVIVDASNGGQGRAVILAIVAFARETGAFMIAEGIEDANTLRGIHLDEPGLTEFWVRGVQGFLLGEPSPSIASFLATPGEAKPAA